MAPKLVLYSDQGAPLTDAVDARLLELLPTQPSTVGYVPSAPDPARSWFAQCASHYARYGITLEFLGLEEEFDAAKFARLLRFDAIHLSGGNTFRFLHWLRMRGAVQELRRYVAEGGVLIGVSAGAILMTPDIGSAVLCGDTPYPPLVDNAGLALVQFGIVPHFDGSDAQLAALSRLAAALGRTAYGIPDGAAVIVSGPRVELIGPVVSA